MAITWDTTALPFQSIMFNRRSLSRSGGQTLTGIEQVVQSSTDFWEAQVTIKVRRQKILSYRAYQAQNWGRAGEWIIPACSKWGLPMGDFAPGFDISFSGDVDPIVFSSTIAATALKGARSASMNLGFVPKPGTFFSLGNRLYVIATVSSGSSPYTVTFAPSLRAAVFTGTTVDFVNPKCLMRLAQDNIGQLNLDMLRFGDVSLNFVEVPT